MAEYSASVSGGVTMNGDEALLDHFSVGVYGFGDPESGSYVDRSFSTSGWENLEGASSQFDHNRRATFGRTPNEMPAWYQEWWDRLFEDWRSSMKSFKKKPYNKD